MRKIFTLSFLLFSIAAFGQQAGSFIVGGSLTRFYPVVFLDNAWTQNTATNLELGRSSVHQDSTYRGSVIAKFRFHSTKWGHGSRFIEADIMQTDNDLGVPSIISRDFIAGWLDGTMTNSSSNTIIWLRGGGTTYFYKSDVVTNPLVYDGVQNPLPLLVPNATSQTYKTVKDTYVNSSGLTYETTAFFNGTGVNYFAGNLGIGTAVPAEKLSVNGNIRAKEVKVETANWPDYVFSDQYELPTLKETELYIKKNGHLSDMPSSAEVSVSGISLGEMNAKLLKKIEELTLHMIMLEKANQNQQREIDLLKAKQ